MEAQNITKLLPRFLTNEIITFTWYDYILFGVMLCVGAAIGIYFGCFGNNKQSTSEYLLGSKKMKVIPVSISLIASNMSGTALLVVPADIYRYGATYWLATPATLLVMICTIYVFLPVFYKLEITSTYEYLELRFNKTIRMFASFLYAFGILLFLPIVIYIPALAFSAISGINVHYITPVVCGICIFYTTLGGIKAVIWTDTLQFSVTVGALITVIIIGIQASGGIDTIWETSVQGDRVNIFDFDLDPTKRDSFWIIMIGFFVIWLASSGVNQSCIQKYLSLPTLRDAKLAVVYFSIGSGVVGTCSSFLGLIMYTRYSECDPFTAKMIAKNDQLIPFYIVDVASHIPGLSGLFMAGVFSAALSTLSASLNCVAATIYEDFIVKFMKPIKKGTYSAFILKMLVIIIGVSSTALIFVIEDLGGILPLSLSLTAITGGPLLGMFVLGVLFPKASSKGTLLGSIFGLLFMSMVFVMAQVYKSNGDIIDTPRPISISGCSINLYNSSDIQSESLVSSLNTSLNNYETVINNRIDNPIDFANWEPFFLFRISFYYYTALGTLATVLPGLLLSYVLPNDDGPVHKDLLSPVIYPFLKISEKPGL